MQYKWNVKNAFETNHVSQRIKEFILSKNKYMHIHFILQYILCKAQKLHRHNSLNCIIMYKLCYENQGLSGAVFIVIWFF